MSEGDTRGIWEEVHANLLGEQPTPRLILHLDRFTLWLPEETWTWELGAIQSIRFTHSSMCLPTCWGESRQPDEEAIPPRSVIKGKSLTACSMCCKLRCARFLQEGTERVMMQLQNVKHTHNEEQAITQQIRERSHTHTHTHITSAQRMGRFVYITLRTHKREAYMNTSGLKIQVSSRGVAAVLRAGADNNINLLNVTQPTHTYTLKLLSHHVRNTCNSQPAYTHTHTHPHFPFRRHKL